MAKQRYKVRLLIQRVVVQEFEAEPGAKAKAEVDQIKSTCCRTGEILAACTIQSLPSAKAKAKPKRAAK